MNNNRRNADRLSKMFMYMYRLSVATRASINARLRSNRRLTQSSSKMAVKLRNKFNKLMKELHAIASDVRRRQNPNITVLDDEVKALNVSMKKLINPLKNIKESAARLTIHSSLKRLAAQVALAEPAAVPELGGIVRSHQAMRPRRMNSPRLSFTPKKRYVRTVPSRNAS